MPKITEERREARRQQILDAARACVLEHGLEATSMEMIIARSGLSTGAVYRYFKGKDEIIAAAFTAATREIGRAIAPILADQARCSPSELAEKLLAAGLTAFLGDLRHGIRLSQKEGRFALGSCAGAWSPGVTSATGCPAACAGGSGAPGDLDEHGATTDRVLAPAAR